MPRCGLRENRDKKQGSKGRVTHEVYRFEDHWGKGERQPKSRVRGGKKDLDIKRGGEPGELRKVHVKKKHDEISERNIYKKTEKKKNTVSKKESQDRSSSQRKKEYLYEMPIFLLGEIRKVLHLSDVGLCEKISDRQLLKELGERGSKKAKKFNHRKKRRDKQRSRGSISWRIMEGLNEKRFGEKELIRVNQRECTFTGT